MTSYGQNLRSGQRLGDVVVERKQFQTEQIGMMQQQLPLMLLADIVAGLYLFAILFSQAQSLTAIVWVAVLILITLVRGLILLRLRSRATSDSNLSVKRRFFILGAASAGILWGNAWLLLPPNPDFMQIATVGVWLAGLQAGSASTMTVSRKIFLAYTIPAFTCFGVFIVLQSLDFKFVLLGAYVMFFAFILPISYHINQSFRNTMILKTHNAVLLDLLEQKAESLSEKERELAESLGRAVLLESQKATANKQLEKEAKQKLLILNAISEGIFGLDTSGNIIYTNDSASQILRFHEDELLNRNIRDFLASSVEKDFEAAQAKFAISNSLQLGISAHNIESYFLDREGHSIPVKFSCTPIWQAGLIQGSVISFLDISRQREMEAMLLQSQKMEAIATLSGGVAHDFNNLLTIILGNLQFLRRHLRGDDHAEQLLGKLIAEAKRGGELNNRLLSFSSEQNQESETISINGMLTEMKDFLDHVLSNSIELELNLPDEELFVATDRTQLQNCILNLCNNASDALPRGGTISISANRHRLARSFVNSDQSRGEADYVEISVKDNGVGIPFKDQKKVFDPFFTTKGKSQGTGLGLATVYGFIRRSKGNITVSSHEGAWTKFRVYLPLVKPGIEATVPELEVTTLHASTERVVLIVEDDNGVRDVAVEALRDSGYRIIAANNGNDGLVAFNKHPEIGLVFSDVIMPGGINGIQMAESMLSVRPETRIILVTGYTDRALRQAIDGNPHVTFLSKPYDVDALPQLLESTLLH